MNQKAKQIIFILMLGSISAVLLLGVRAYTYPVIGRHEESALKSTVLRAAGIDYDKRRLDEVFDDNIKTIKEDGSVYYLSPDGYYIFEFLGRGLWGMISGTITLRPDLETIENVQIISQEETPGLGGRISEKQFLDQFRQKKAAPKLNLALRQKAARDNEVDSISGASITSGALVGMINRSVQNFREKIGK